MANYIRFDWAMKRMLRDKANHAVLEGLMTALLGEKFTIVKFLESEGNQTDEEDKFNRVDILAESDRGELTIFEIQNFRELSYYHRMMYGTSKLITDYINLAQNYGKVAKLYSVNIVYYSLDLGKDYVYHGKTVFRGLHNTDDVLKLSKHQQELFFGTVSDDGETKDSDDLFPNYYMLNVNNFDSIATTPLDEWIEFLKTGEISSDTNVPGLVEALECLDIANMSAEDRRAYFRHLDNLCYQKSVISTSYDDGMQEGLRIGREEGLEIARKQEKLIIAQKIKRLGVPVETIIAATGLSADEIESL